ncbi:hypothetical protein CVT24_008991 [Panaeolus cyanescens]|uniref:BHLH domain-containing protein n=1 Tax=Panaeolus cyanescens TaxID=181874 RepID=A0A409WTZ7_9AGAR|nr:hypothetical protein CVT24_008991 [Panaeolus cyanescens]
MAPATPTAHDPALSHPAPAAPVTQAAPPPAQPAPNVAATDIPGLHLSGLDQSQILNLLRSLPGVFTKLNDQGANPKEDAAQALSNLSQAPFGAPHVPVHFPQGAATGLPGINDPGPSSHPRGPPNLGQLSAVAMQAPPLNVQPQPHPQAPPRPEDSAEQIQNAAAGAAAPKDASAPPASAPATTSTGGRRGGRSATMGSDEWTRQRKDNHKEVERRRRGNINEGINELGRIVPNGSGEKAKGAILARAVQYIHHLKENEARNIEKWTLEKLLMDQAMGDLQSQLEEIKRLWDEERVARNRLDQELDALRKSIALGNNAPVDDGSATGAKKRSADETAEASTAEGAATTASAGESERDGKRQRTE